MDSHGEGITVGVRMRPLNAREVRDGLQSAFKCKESTIHQCSKDGQIIDSTYTYNKVFGEEATNLDVYNSLAKNLVQGVVNGINGTIFAYGQTSSGKTHTMAGCEGCMGLTEMCAIDIFNQLAASTSQTKYAIKVSYLEIYNEIIRDLLSEDKKELKIREDPLRGVFIEATEVVITDFETIMSSVKKGLSKRSVETTNMNEASSRSHSVFKLTLESQAEDGTKLISSLNLVDLAGSESVKHTGAEGQKAKEGGKINQSLLSLSRVISALAENNKHVGFRDSKLTRLLQPSLAGNAKMSIVCCITPADRYLDETRSTLQFASRAKLVKTNAKVNEVVDDAVLIKRYIKELEDTKEKLRVMESAAAAAMNGGQQEEVLLILEEKNELLRVIDEKNAEIANKDARLNTLNAKLLTSSQVMSSAPVSSAFPDSMDFDSFPHDMSSSSNVMSSSKKSKKTRSSWCPQSLVASVESKADFQPAQSFAFSHKLSSLSERTSLSSECSTVPEDSTDDHADDLMSSEEYKDQSASELQSALAAKDQIIQELQNKLYGFESNQIASNNESEFAALRAQLAQCETQCSELASDLEAARDTITSLQAEIETSSVNTLVFGREFELMSEKTALTSELASTTSALEALQVVLREVQAKATEESVRQSEAVSSLQAVVTALKTEAQAVAEDISEFECVQEELGAANEELAGLKATLSESETTVAEQEEKLSELREALESAQSAEIELSHVVEAMNNLQNEFSSLKAESDEAAVASEEKVSELMNRVASLESDLQSTKASVESSERLVTLEIELTAARETVAECETKIVALEQTAADVEAENQRGVSALEADLAAAQDTITVLEAEVVSTRDSLVSTESRARDCQTALEADLQTARDSAGEFSARLTALDEYTTDTVAEMQTALTAKTAELEAAEQMIASLKCESGSEVQRLAEECAALKTSCGDLETRLCAKEGECEALTSQVDALTVSVADAESRLESLQSELADARASLDGAVGTISTMADEVSNLEQQLAASQTQKDSLEQQIQELAAQSSESIETSDSQVAVLMLNVSDANDELAVKQQELVVANDAITSLQQQVASLLAEHSTLQFASQGAEELSGEMISSLETQIASTQSELTVSREEVVRLVVDLAAASTEVTSLAAQLWDKSAREMTLETEIATLHTQLETALFTAAQMDASKLTIDDLQQDISDLRDDAIQLQEEVQLKDEQLDALESVVSELQSDLFTATSAQAFLETQISETTALFQLQLAEKNGDLSEAHAIIASSWSQPDYVSTQGEMNALRSALDTQSFYSAELEKGVESLEAELNVVREECAVLQQDIQCREEQICALESNANQFQQMVSLKQRLSAKDAQIESLQASLVQAEESAAVQMDLGGGSQNEANEVEVQMDILRVTVSDLESQLEGREDELKSLREELGASQQMVSELESALEAAQNEADELAVHCDEKVAMWKSMSTETIGTMRASQKETEVELQLARENVTQLEAKVASLEGVASSSSHSEDLQAELEAASELAAAQKGAITDLTAEIAAHRESLSDLTTLLESTIAAKEASEVEAAQMSEEITLLQAFNSELEAASDESKNAISALQNSIDADSELTAQLRSELSEAVLKIESLEASSAMAAAVDVSVEVDSSALEAVTAQLQDAQHAFDEEMQAANEECALLKQQVASLEDKLDDVNRASKADKGRVLSLLQEVAVSDGERDAAHTALQEKLAVFAAFESTHLAIKIQLEEHVRSLEVQIGDLSAALQQTEVKLSNTSIIAPQQAPAHTHKSSVGSMNETEVTQDGLNTARRDMERQVEAMRSELGHKESEVSRLMAVVSEMTGRAHTAEQNLSTLNNTANSAAGGEDFMRKKISQLQTNVDLLTGERDSVVAKMTDMEVDFKQRNGHNAVYAEQLERKLNEQSRLMDKKSSDSSASDRMSEAIVSLERRLAETKGERDEAKEYAALAAQKIDQLEASMELSASSGSDSDVIVSLRAELSDAEGRESALKADVSRMEQDLHEATQRMKKSHNETAMLNSELAANEKTILALTATIDDLEGELSAVRNEVQDLTVALEEADALIDKKENTPALADELEELRASENQLTADLSEARSQIEHADCTLGDLTVKLLETEEALRAREEELHASQSECAALRELEADLNDNVSLLRGEMAKGKEMFLAQRSELVQLTAAHIELKQQSLEMEFTLSEMQSAQADSDSLVSANEQIEALRCELAERDNDLDSQQTEMEEVQSQLSAAREEIIVLTAVETELREQCAALKTAGSALRNEFSKLQNQAVEHETEMLELQAAKSRLQNYIDEDVAEKIADLEHKVAEISSQNATISGDLRKKSAECSALAENSALNEDLVQSLQEQIVAKDARIEHLDSCKLTKDQMEKIKTIKEERKKYQGDAQTLKKQLHELKKAYDAQKTTVSEMSAAVASNKGGPSVEYHISDLKFQLAEVNEQLARSQAQFTLCRDKLKECSKQMEEYEKDRAAVLSLLEKHGIDTLSLVSLDTSLASENASSMEAQIELADAVGKLAEKLVASQAMNAHKDSHKSSRLLEVTEKLQLSVSEVEDLKVQRLALERRVESMKTAARTSREEAAVLSVEIDALKGKVAEVTGELALAKQKVTLSSDNTSSEIQVLEEENIELLQENKELRAKISKLRIMGAVDTHAAVHVSAAAAVVMSTTSNENSAPLSPAPSSSSSSAVNKKATCCTTPSVGQKRAFGTDVTNTIHSSSSSSSSKKASSSSVSKQQSLSALVTGGVGGVEQQQVRKKVAKPLVAAADEENPGECNQS